MTKQPTNEELLRQVIEAQVKNGFRRFEWMLDDKEEWEICTPEFGEIVSYDEGEVTHFHLLEILFDTEALKKVYTGYYCEDCGGRCAGSDCPFHGVYWQRASHRILNAWNSGEGNNTRESLKCAVEFLPTES